MLGVLGRDEHPMHTDRLAVLVPHGHLRLAVRTEVAERPILAHDGEPFGQAVRQLDCQRHTLRRLVDGIPEHDALITRPEAVERIGRTVARLEGLEHTSGNVRALTFDDDFHVAGVGGE